MRQSAREVKLFSQFLMAFRGRSAPELKKKYKWNSSKIKISFNLSNILYSK